jgi:hypothetical protein
LPDTLGNSEQYFHRGRLDKVQHRQVGIHKERVAEMEQQSIEMNAAVSERAGDSSDVERFWTPSRR